MKGVDILNFYKGGGGSWSRKGVFDTRYQPFVVCVVVLKTKSNQNIIIYIISFILYNMLQTLLEADQPALEIS